MSYTRDKRVEKIREMVSETLDENDTEYMVWKRKVEELIFEYQNPHIFGLQSTWEFSHHNSDVIKDALWKLIRYMVGSHPNYVESPVLRRGKLPKEE